MFRHFAAKKCHRLTTRPGYIPVQVQSQYVSIIVRMPESLCCTKNELLREFCLHTRKTIHGWQYKKNACVASAGPPHMQQLATCDKLNHIHGYQPVSHKNRSAQQWAELTTFTWLLGALADLVQVFEVPCGKRDCVPTRNSIIQCFTVGCVPLSLAPLQTCWDSKTFITPIRSHSSSNSLPLVPVCRQWGQCHSEGSHRRADD